MAIPGAHIRAGRGSEPVGRRGPKTSPKCWYMYGLCWATSISKLMFPKKYAWYPPLKTNRPHSPEEELHDMLYNEIVNVNVKARY